MPKIGVSLPPRIFNEASGDFLARFAAAGVSHVELRAILPEEDDALFASCAKAIAQAGLFCTVHSALTGADVSALCRSIPENLPKTVFTVHAVTGENKQAAAEETVAKMRLFGSVLEKGGHVLSIENNRRKGNLDPGDSFDGAFAIFQAVNRENMGITFDFGHYYYNAVTFHRAPRMLPAAKQLAAVCHTHIHGIAAGKTHHPLNDDSVPVEFYVAALQNVGYTGVYNLEISLPAAAPLVLDGILASVDRLAKILR